MSHNMTSQETHVDSARFRDAGGKHSHYEESRVEKVGAFPLSEGIPPPLPPCGPNVSSRLRVPAGPRPGRASRGPPLPHAVFITTIVALLLLLLSLSLVVVVVVVVVVSLSLLLCYYVYVVYITSSTLWSQSLQTTLRRGYNGYKG